MPRTGSSLLASLIQSAGYNAHIKSDSLFLQPSEFNPDGYFEETGLTLLNDQLIRCLFGMEHSFLYTPHPPFNYGYIKRFEIDPNFFYDIEEKSLSTPLGFEKDFNSFTGHSWDPWGLTRMINGGKWYRCYQKYGCETGKKIREKILEYSTIFNAPKGLVVKDPRLALTFGVFNVKAPKIIILRRNGESCLKSIRNHYGQHMFTNKLITGEIYCSNHFNYKIKPQKFHDYVNCYESYFSSATSILGARVLEIDLDDLLTKGSRLSELEDFVKGTIDQTLVRNGNGNGKGIKL